MDDVLDELEYSLAEVNQVIEEIKSMASPETNPYRLQNINGEFTLVQPLHTKAILLTAIIPLRKEREQRQLLEKARRSFLDAVEGAIKPDVLCSECTRKIEYVKDMDMWRHIEVPIGEPHKAKP